MMKPEMPNKVSTACEWQKRCLLSSVAADPQESAAVQKHMLQCGDCLAIHSEVTEIVAALRSLPQQEMPDIVPAVMARIAGRRRLYLPELNLSRLARAAGILLVAGAAALAIFHSFRHQITGPCLTFTERDKTEEETSLSASNARSEALAWLADTQRQDGTWDVLALGGRPAHAPALTALALMALQDADDDSFRETIMRGAEALRQMQSPSGLFGTEDPFMMYNHGMATVALLRIFSGHPQQSLKPALDAAIDFIRTAQQPAGGWGYRPAALAGSAEANASVSAWQLDALGMARQLGWSDDRGHLRRGLFWLASLADSQGLVGYHQPGDLPSARLTTTALGLYCLTRAGEGLQGVLPVARSIAAAFKPLVMSQTWENDPNPYRDYFVAMAAERWDSTVLSPAESPDLSAMRNTLAKTRIIADSSHGLWLPGDAYAKVGGELYSTSLSSMALKTP